MPFQMVAFRQVIVSLSERTMHIRITSVSWEEIGERLGNASVALEDRLNPLLASRNYGEIERFMAVIVAVDSDPIENNRLATGYNKVGTYTHPTTGKRVKYISLALPFDPVVIKSAGSEQLLQLIVEALLNALENNSVKIPKSFHYSEFVKEMRCSLEVTNSSTRQRVVGTGGSVL